MTVLVILAAVVAVIALGLLALWAASRADPRPKLRHALKHGDLVQARAILSARPALAKHRDARGSTLLHDAGSAEVAHVLVEAGAVVDMPNDAWATPLYTVDDEATFLALMDAGADIRNRTRNGTTALHHAAQRGWETAVQRLLERGMEIGIRDAAGNTALHRVPPHYGDMVHQLLESGADPNASNDRRETALHCFVSWVPAGKIKTEIRTEGQTLGEGAIDRWFPGIRVLVDSGANLGARADSGETPLARAKHRMANEEVIAYLEAQVASARVRS